MSTKNCLLELIRKGFADTASLIDKTIQFYRALEIDSQAEYVTTKIQSGKVVDTSQYDVLVHIPLSSGFSKVLVSIDDIIEVVEYEVV